MIVSRVELDGIFAEIDEQMEAENVARWWIANRYWVMTGLGLLFLGLFVYVGWMEYQKKLDQEVAGHYLLAMDSLDSGDTTTSRKGLNEVLVKYGDHGFAQLARFMEARTLVQDGKNEAAAQMLEQVAALSEPPLKNLAIINSAFVIADDAKLAVKRLGNIPKESVFKAHALELEGVLTVRQGDPKGGLAHYKEALALKPEGGLRKRLERRVQRLGG